MSLKCCGRLFHILAAVKRKDLVPYLLVLTWGIEVLLCVYFRNTTVDLSHIDTPPNMSAWPHFHNGVAAGLRIADFSQVITLIYLIQYNNFIVSSHFILDIHIIL